MRPRNVHGAPLVGSLAALALAAGCGGSSGGAAQGPFRSDAVSDLRVEYVEPAAAFEGEVALVDSETEARVHLGLELSGVEADVLAAALDPEQQSFLPGAFRLEVPDAFLDGELHRATLTFTAERPDGREVLAIEALDVRLLPRDGEVDGEVRVQALAPLRYTRAELDGFARRFDSRVTGEDRGAVANRVDFACPDRPTALKLLEFILTLWDEDTAAPRITTTKLPRARLKRPYKAKLEAEGGLRPLRWSVVKGELPPGLSLNSKTGVIHGTVRPLLTKRALVADGVRRCKRSYDLRVRVVDGAKRRDARELRIDVVRGLKPCLKKPCVCRVRPVRPGDQAS